MLNRELEVTLNLAFKEARSKRHEFMTVEHLLLALLDNEAAATVLRACGANLDKLKHDLQEFIDSTTPLIPVNDEDRETQPTPASSVYCNVPCSTCKAPASVKSPAPTCWWRSSANRKARPCSCSSSRAWPASTWSTTSPMASPRCRAMVRIPKPTRNAGRRGRRYRFFEQPAGCLCQQPERAGPCWPYRPAGRPRAGSGARGADSCPSPQEQPAAGG